MKLFEGTLMTFQPGVAEKIGLNEAIILQQLYYLIENSSLIVEGVSWYVHTYDSWNKRFGFWSKTTIKRIFLKLEQEGFIISTTEFNRLPFDRRKWYRLNYETLAQIEGLELLAGDGPASIPHGQEFQNSPTKGLNRNDIAGQNSALYETKMIPDINNNSINTYTKEVNTKRKKECLAPYDEIIHYLNTKAGKSYKPSSEAIRKQIAGRLQEGYSIEDFKIVIDQKVGQWLNDPKMNHYLRPSTLFKQANFENYLNESIVISHQPPQQFCSIELDYSAGEEELAYIPPVRQV